MQQYSQLHGLTHNKHLHGVKTLATSHSGLLSNLLQDALGPIALSLRLLAQVQKPRLIPGLHHGGLSPKTP